MAHSYRIKRDTKREVIYEKSHSNGETTTVVVERAGTKAAGGHVWLVNVRDPNGSRRVGRFGTKGEAKQAATRWMNNHPKGVRGRTQPGAIGALDQMEQATENIFTGGGRFK